MTNKEEKFWGAVRASEKDWQAASDLLTVLWTKNMSPVVCGGFSARSREGFRRAERDRTSLSAAD